MGNYVVKEQWVLGDFGGGVTISRSIGIVLSGSVFHWLHVIAQKEAHYTVIGVLPTYISGDFAFKKNKDLDREKQMLVCDPDILAVSVTKCK